MVISRLVPRLTGSLLSYSSDGEHDRLGGVVDVQILATGGARSPHLDLLLATFFRLDATLDARRDDVADRRMELVARSVEIGGDQIRETLAVLRAVHLRVDEVRLLRDAVRRVGFLRVAIPQALLAKRHRRELRVRAHRADQHGLLDRRCHARGLDHVRAHQQVVEIQRRRRLLVETNATDACREVHDVARPRVGEQALGDARHGQVVVATAGHGDVRAERLAACRPRHDRETRLRR